MGWVMKKRKLFCEISPFTYEISLWKERIKRRVRDFKNATRFAKDQKNIELTFYDAPHYLYHYQTKEVVAKIEDFIEGTTD